MKEFLSRELPEAVMYIPEATYLAWVNMGKCLPDGTDLPDFFANKAGVLLRVATHYLWATPPDTFA